MACGLIPAIHMYYTMRIHIINAFNNSHMLSRPFGDCYSDTYVAWTNFWSWLENATYAGKSEFNGIQVDVWTYKVMHACNIICMCSI